MVDRTNINPESIAAPSEEWEKMGKPERQLHRVRIRLDDIDRAFTRFTLDGRPMLIVDEYYTVMYYENNKSFSIYTGYREFNTEQKRFDFKTFGSVAEFLNDPELGNR